MPPLLQDGQDQGWPGVRRAVERTGLRRVSAQGPVTAGTSCLRLNLRGWFVFFFFKRT